MAYSKDKTICGVYTITHIPTARIYVGSSVNIYHRWANHRSKLRDGTHENEYLQATWNKYDESEFEFCIVAIATRDNIHDIEHEWMNKTNCTNRSTGFNICLEPQVRTGVPLSESHRSKLSESLKGRTFSNEHRQKLSDALKGRSKPPHVIDAVRRANTGRTPTIEQRQAHSEKMKGIGNGNAKITEDDVRAIKRLLAQKVSAQKITKLYPIARTQVYRIARGEQWAHII